MTTSKQTLENIASTLNAIASHMGVTPGGASAPEATPNDPLSEVVPYNHKSPDVSSYHHLTVVQRLQRMDEPRTIRNLLREYMNDSVCAPLYTLKSPTTGALFTIYRPKAVSLKGPSGLEYERLYTTPHFPLCGGVGFTNMVGWTIQDEYRVIDAFGDCGHKYLITERI
jgi:hypothetical protein|nr:MAG TPA: hypothetical protein [Caudoviricetes sp.]